MVATNDPVLAVQAERIDMFECRVCGNRENNTRLIAREMAFGLREEFEYFECSSCGCLQIVEIPSDLSKYYPQNYYSFSAPNDGNVLKQYLKRKWISHALGRQSLIGQMLVKRWGVPQLAQWVEQAGVGFGQAILDIGCGTGHLLLVLRNAGFSNLTGIDTHLARDFHYRNGVVVLKRALDDIEGVYDFVMLHDSFEHMPDPLSTLWNVHRLLKPNRFALIRMPVARSYARQIYGVDWVQLDAPRHLFVHTEESLRILASTVGFEIATVIYDSTSFQFWGSEQHKRGIPLCATNFSNSMFSKEELEIFGAKAEMLNLEGKGDHACFYLRKTCLSAT